MEQFEKFQKPKPPFFSFRIDVRPERQWQLESDFSDEFIAKLDEADGIDNTHLKKSKTPSEQAAELTAARHLSAISSGLKFISKEQKIIVFVLFP